MKKRLFVIVVLVILITVFLLFFQNDSEKISFKDQTVDSVKKDFQVYLNDDCIYFYDTEGNAVIYNFSGDRVSEAFTLIEVSSLNEANAVKDFYMNTIGSGDVKEIITEENVVTIVYNESYIKGFEGYTKKDIEALLKNGD